MEDRGDLFAKDTARHADYILSCAAADAGANDPLIRRLCSLPVNGAHGDGPITFCTESSLGLGGDFDEYFEAASETKHGMLIVNPSQNYYREAVCVQHSGKIPRNLIHIYHSRQGRVVPQVDWGSECKPFESAVMDAARNGNAAEVVALCNADSNAVHSKDDAGTTALILAARNGHAEVVRILIAARADVLCQVNSGYTAIHAAAQGCRISEGVCRAERGH
ncbi:unnamed protein product [Polarella glacialis]|uniref:Uncharacterized protein n=1 Tax=Polarella glacialis TaxID=89957 RepID=A0A813DJ06_POLGL|nr:unnamed protein product [Polarella glacialis]CAE8591452.1 unnamed protein product [Polarella glacialis]